MKFTTLIQLILSFVILSIAVKYGDDYGKSTMPPGPKIRSREKIVRIDNYNRIKELTRFLRSVHPSNSDRILKDLFNPPDQQIITIVPNKAPHLHIQQYVDQKTTQILALLMDDNSEKILKGAFSPPDIMEVLTRRSSRLTKNYVGIFEQLDDTQKQIIIDFVYGRITLVFRGTLGSKMLKYKSVRQTFSPWNRNHWFFEEHFRNLPSLSTKNGRKAKNDAVLQRFVEHPWSSTSQVNKQVVMRIEKYDNVISFFCHPKTGKGKTIYYPLYKLRGKESWKVVDKKAGGLLKNCQNIIFITDDDNLIKPLAEEFTDKNIRLYHTNQINKVIEKTLKENDKETKGDRKTDEEKEIKTEHHHIPHDTARH